MSTRASASAVFPLPIERVWAAVRDFQSVPRHFPSVNSVALEGEGNGHTVGVVRVVKWKSGEERRQQLIELSDQYKKITWETVGANHQTESSAQISTLRLFRVTETKETLVEWSTEFAADVDAKTIEFESKNILQNLKDLRAALVAAATHPQKK